jgi:hypothetical protein
MRTRWVKQGEAARPRWIRVRAVTDDGAYVGRLKLQGKDHSLTDVVADARAYLGLWSVVQEPSGQRDEFVALHKGTIRYVVQLAGVDAADAKPASV